MRNPVIPDHGHWENRIRELGREYEVGPTLLSRLSGLSRNSINEYWHNCLVIPAKHQTVEGLCKVFDVEPMDLIHWVPGRDGSQAPTPHKPLSPEGVTQLSLTVSLNSAPV